MTTVAIPPQLMSAAKRRQAAAQQAPTEPADKSSVPVAERPNDKGRPA